MDANLKIIEGVEQFPCLHGNSDNLDERNKAWILLAEKLQMPEIFLKIRWHSLLQEYQHDPNFKYANSMHFVFRNEEKKQVENWPEFIITEEDLKDEKREEGEAFVLLESDDSTKCFKPEFKEANNLNEISNKMVELQKEHNNEDLERSIAENNTPEGEHFCEELLEKHNRDKDFVIDSNKECDISNVTTLNVVEKVTDVHVNKNNKINMKDSKEVANEKSQSLTSERCEDVIFGELVSATLKRMDENKKKSIKREIMNLLFS